MSKEKRSFGFLNHPTSDEFAQPLITPQRAQTLGCLYLQERYGQLLGIAQVALSQGKTVHNEEMEAIDLALQSAHNGNFFLTKELLGTIGDQLKQKRDKSGNFLIMLSSAMPRTGQPFQKKEEISEEAA